MSIKIERIFRFMRSWIMAIIGIPTFIQMNFVLHWHEGRTQISNGIQFRANINHSHVAIQMSWFVCAVNVRSDRRNSNFGEIMKTNAKTIVFVRNFWTANILVCFSGKAPVELETRSTTLSQLSAKTISASVDCSSKRNARGHVSTMEIDKFP